MNRTKTVATLALLLLAGCGSASPPPARFDERRAWSLIELQVAAGQRPAGSRQLRRLAVRLRDRMPGGRFEAIPGQPGLRNVVARLPGRRPGIVVGAHYDTLVKPKGFVGANNGAAGSAIVVELSRALSRMPRPRNAREVTFVLFDGEEPPSGLPEDDPDFANSGLRGSRAYVRAHPDETAQMILLDYVGNRGLRLPREGTSDVPLWNALRAAAGAVGQQSVFPDETGTAIIDDHTPFLETRVPAIDLIDWSYPGHTLQDGIDQLSPKAIDAVGESVLELVTRLERG
ncbi:M28 family metallopeptidase [Solirubrobacter ginsenosidimutans]|uniref:M28 family metallopeptidase n=1 Tax=Solirubrobacter ginsenosidimutans TaxID=490573 RepID=A0A9X3MUI3_9ACTN|nr:M28 family metallopeptidase [Solirubrobacter ginsenosidimutans]MDA0163251.1 M28 family metallopeptidase [Solirubrobacter ginsenosidimutans]